MGRTRWWFAVALVLVGSVSWGQQCGAGGTVVTNPTLVPAGSFQQVAADIFSGAFGPGGFLTKISLVNLSSSPNTVVFNDISESGALLASCSYSIPGNGTLRLAEGSITGASDVHWGLVGSTAPVGVNLFFELTQNNAVVNTVGFNDLAPRTTFTFPVEFQNSPFHTLGLALANPNSSSNTVTVSVVDQNGNTLGSKQQVLPAYGHLSEDLLTSANPLSINSFLPPGDFIGTVQVTTTAPASTVAVGDDQGPFFSEAPMFVQNTATGVPDLSTTVTLTSSDPSTTISPGTCNTIGVPLTGARSTMTMIVSPASDPSASGYINVLWNAWIDANDHVSLELCKFAFGSASLNAPLTFNLRALVSSQPSSTATLVVPGGSVIPNIPHTNTQQCLEVTAALPAATPSNAVVITPASDPGAVGWNDIQWRGYIPAAGHIGGIFCKPGGQSGPTSAPLTFNVALLN